MKLISRNVAFWMVFSTASCTQVPQILKYEATPQIVKGQQAKLSWEIIPNKSIQSIEIMPLNEKLLSKGEINISPSQTQGYKLSITYKKAGKTKTIEQLATVNVISPTFKSVFTGSKQIIVGDEGELAWKLHPEAKNIVLQEIQDGKIIKTWDKMPLEASYEIRPVANTSFVLTAAVGNDEIKLTHPIEVIPAFFTGNHTILAGDEARLIWKINPHFKSITLERRENDYIREILARDLPANGSYMIKPEESTEYLLTWIDATETHFLHKVEVLQGIFKGTEFINTKEEAFLSWRTNPKSKKVWIEMLEGKEQKILKNNLPVEGQLAVRPSKSTKYFLHIENQDNQVSIYAHTVKVKSDTEVTAQNSQGRVLRSPLQEEEIIVTELNSSAFKPIISEPHIPKGEKTIVYFDFGGDNINEESKSMLSSLILQLKKEPDTILEIVGHSDLKGTSEGCLKISVKRAETVRKYLVDNGIDDHRILTKAMSRTHPIWFTESTQKQAQENRRVEILVIE